MATIHLNSLDVCPFCGRYDTEVMDSEVCEGVLTERVHCLRCDETWTNEYQYRQTHAEVGDHYYDH